jgi:hypothetical protein
MADTPLATFVRPPVPTPAAIAPAAKKALVARLATMVGNHAYLSLATIVVLTIVLVALYVYYHGFLFLGPYKASAATRGAKAAKKKDARGTGKTNKNQKPEDAEEAEIERLIETIDQQ